MKRIAVALMLSLSASLALANSCPKEMKAIDAALPKAKLDDKQMAEVRRLRQEGEKLHDAGKHTESLAALNKAKAILKIK